MVKVAFGNVEFTFSTASLIISELLSKYSSNPYFVIFFYNLVEIPPQTLMVIEKTCLILNFKKYNFELAQMQ